jgi:predicted nucleic acid-binding protein
MVALLQGSPETVAKIKELLESNEQVAITDITAYELLKGAYHSKKRQENVSAITKAIAKIPVLPFSPQACQEAARIYNQQKQAGQLMSEFCVIIAAIAKANGQAILTRDPHFEVVAGLSLVKW